MPSSRSSQSMEAQIMASNMLRTAVISDREASPDTSRMDTREGSSARGRQRGRSLTRSRAPRKSLRTDETSTLRGRSRERALSPHGGRSPRTTSNSASTSLMSPSRQLLHSLRIPESRRRQHCPSRATSPSRRSSPSSLAVRRTRTRSRRRSPAPRAVLESSRFSLDHHQLSGLRHEILADSSDGYHEDGPGPSTSVR
jgi:hypothetical protein